MNRSGFTIVELVITLTVIAILLSLGVVSLLSSQKNARDAERQSDIEVIARGLEQYYTLGNPYYIPGGTKGTYPGSDMMVSIMGDGWCSGSSNVDPAKSPNYSVCKPGEGYPSEVFPGVSSAALTPPGYTKPELKQPWGQPEASPVGIISPQITSDIDAGRYVYKPLNDDNSLCYGDTTCRKYALIYKKESTPEVVIVKSKRQ